MRRPSRVDLLLSLLSAGIECLLLLKLAQRRGWTFHAHR